MRARPSRSRAPTQPPPRSWRLPPLGAPSDLRSSATRRLPLPARRRSGDTSLRPFSAREGESARFLRAGARPAPRAGARVRRGRGSTPSRACNAFRHSVAGVGGSSARNCSGAGHVASSARSSAVCQARTNVLESTASTSIPSRRRPRATIRKRSTPSAVSGRAESSGQRAESCASAIACRTR